MWNLCGLKKYKIEINSADRIRKILSKNELEYGVDENSRKKNKIKCSDGLE